MGAKEEHATHLEGEKPGRTYLRTGKKGTGGQLVKSSKRKKGGKMERRVLWKPRRKPPSSRQRRKNDMISRSITQLKKSTP